MRTTLLRSVLMLLLVSSAIQVGPAADETRKSALPDRLRWAPTAIPDRVCLCMTATPATSMAVTWRTDVTVTDAVAQIAVADHGPGFANTAVTVSARSSTFESNLNESLRHEVTFSSLLPATKYAYRVGDGANWSEWNHFTTAAESPAPFQVLYVGDAQNDIEQFWSRVVREAFAESPRAAFFIHAGDLVNTGGHDGHWGEWFSAGGFVQRMIPGMPVPGNHEYIKETEADDSPRILTPQWRATFAMPENGLPDLPETNYWFDYQGVRLIALNSNTKTAEQAAWLRRILADNPQRWTVATFHHPLFSTRKGRDNKALREAWLPVFDEYGVDLVLQGHDHTYARTGLVSADDTKPDADVAAIGSRVQTKPGAVFVVSVSGPKMYPLEPVPLNNRTAEDTQLFQVIEFSEQAIHYRALTATGTLYDEFELTKTPDGERTLTNLIPDIQERRRPPESAQVK
ncbi:MAG: metallophosphoesterase family protein [Planctomycetaceae bacterium]|nr:metallophosphoesterase family protein [Planctomycetaceae bacterium]